MGDEPEITEVEKVLSEALTLDKTIVIRNGKIIWKNGSYLVKFQC